MASIPSELAATLQAGHIRRHPDPNIHLAPSTAADEKETLTLGRAHYSHDGDEIPYSVLGPPPPRRVLPALPDLRFEQSYLHSISNADRWWKVLLITTRDQVLMPLVQGLAYNLLICGWQHWNRNSRIHGNTMGAKIRRWWYGVNKWKIPSPTA
ncbi:hypothetical protein CDD81_6182 [Ophiocordyceps australis]|uniref:DUF1770 domain-containing protein n=1 Tax=Ophiocordyceps australis TaxID=1399860 RepID=A0A2C5Y715_9HYPO|nr:hypothetical protein CDD81_6182 [Ophiocordyceps australis]